MVPIETSESSVPSSQGHPRIARKWQVLAWTPDRRLEHTAGLLLQDIARLTIHPATGPRVGADCGADGHMMAPDGSPQTFDLTNVRCR